MDVAIFFGILLKAFVQRQEKIAFASFTCSFKAEDTTKRNTHPKYTLGSMETVKLEGSYQEFFCITPLFPLYGLGEQGPSCSPRFPIFSWRRAGSRRQEAFTFAQHSEMKAACSPPLIGERSRLGREPGNESASLD